MTNLDKILDRIRQDAQDKALALDRDADEEIARLKESAEEETASEVRAVLEGAEKDAEKIVTLAKSAAVALRKKKALEAKSRALDEAIAEALKALAALPEKDYAALVLTLVENNTDEQAGEVFLAAGRPVADREAFAAKLAALPGKKLTLSDKTVPLATGALVSYGKIVLDLSFEAVVLDKKDDVRDRLADLIFRDAAKE